MATTPTLPTEHVQRILLAAVENLRWIDPANDARFGVKTLASGLLDADLPEGVESFYNGTTEVQGVIFVVTDKDDDYEYLTASRVRGTLQYDVECYLKRDDGVPDDPNTALTRQSLMDAQQAFWTAHWNDLHLRAADARLQGGAAVRLVTNHRIQRIVRQYAPPDAYFRAAVKCVYDFSADAAS